MTTLTALLELAERLAATEAAMDEAWSQHRDTEHMRLLDLSDEQFTDFSHMAQEAIPELRSLLKRHEEMRLALEILYEETKDYITINHLGDPHHNRSMQLAREALSALGEE